MLAILVTGSRHARIHHPHEGIVWGALSNVLLPPPPEGAVLYHGGAKGVDTMAQTCAEALGYGGSKVFPYPEGLGRAGGPIRNQQMVDALVELKEQGHKALVLAFPCKKSRGTWDCIRKATKAGLDVYIIPLEEEH